MKVEFYKPDIGQECEVLVGMKWVKAKCVGYDHEGIVWKSSHVNYNYSPFDEVRECKSELDIFKEEFIEFMHSNSLLSYTFLNPVQVELLMNLLYNNGYRKVEESI